jgi:WD40 repeat protein
MAVTSRPQVVNIKRELKVDLSLSFQKPIKAAIISDDGVVVHHTSEDDHHILQHPLEQDRQEKKFTVTVAIKKFLYAKDLKAYIAFCNDYRLRVYNLYFELLATLPVSANVLSMCYNESTCELLAGGLGFVYSWTILIEETDVLHPNPNLKFGLQEWESVISLSVCHYNPLLVAACEKSIYILDAKNHTLQYKCATTHNTCAAIYSPLHYVICGTKEGHIKILNYTLKKSNILLQHSKQITSLMIHSSMPYMISSSYDNTIRVWNLQTLAPCFVFSNETHYLITDVTLDGGIVCYSEYNFILLKFNEVEEVFSVLNSNVISLLSQVHKKSERIVSLSDDGTVHILSSVTGQTLTIVFPILSAQLLNGIGYNTFEDHIYLSMHTGEILVYDCTVNPCIPKQLLMPMNSKQEVTCIVTVDTLIGPLLLAGHSSGCLSILYANDCKIDHPFPAHDGPIVKITASFMRNDDNDNPAINVVTLGIDSILQIWSIEIKNSKLSITKQLVIHNLTCISCDSDVPSHISLVDMILCIATTETFNVIMYNLPHQDNIFSLNNIKPMTHPLEENHTASITSLSGCPKLVLFATSCSNGLIKVWNRYCQLLSNINLGSCISSICFTHINCDIIFGYQNQLFKIQSHCYLPRYFLDQIKTDLQYSSNEIEAAFPFQSKLKFWYDCQRVPTIPVLPQTRHQSVVKPINPYTLRLITRPQFDTLIYGNEAMNRSNFKQKNARKLGIADPELARTLSHKNQSKPHGLKQIFKSCISTSSLATELIEASDGDDLINTDALIYNKVSNYEKSHKETHPPAFTIPIKNQSMKHSIAPDGYIPNSIIKAKVDSLKGENEISKDLKFEQMLQKLYEKQELMESMLAAQKRKYTKTPPKNHFNSGSHKPRNATYQRVNIEFPNDTETTKDHRTDSVKLTRRHTTPSNLQRPHSGMSTKSSDDTSSSDDEDQELHSHPSPIAEIDERDVSSTTSINHQGQPIDTNLVTLVDQNIEEESLDRKGNRRMFFSPESKMRGLMLSQRTWQRDISFAKRRSKYENEEEVHAVKSAPCIKEHMSSIINYYSDVTIGRGYYRNDYNLPEPTPAPTPTPTALTPITIKINDVGESPSQMNDLLDFISKIIDSSWFPSNELGMNIASENTLDWVITKLLDLLEKADSKTFAKITKALTIFNNSNYLTEEHRAKAFDIIAKRQKETKSNSIKANILTFLQDMTFDGNEALLLIMQSLVNPNQDIRTTAFATIKNLTGVTTRVELHKLLIERGLIIHVDANEDEIIKDLAQRLQNTGIQSAEMPAKGITSVKSHIELIKNHMNKATDHMSVATDQMSKAFDKKHTDADFKFVTAATKHMILARNHMTIAKDKMNDELGQTGGTHQNVDTQVAKSAADLLTTEANELSLSRPSEIFNEEMMTKFIAAEKRLMNVIDKIKEDIETSDGESLDDEQNIISEKGNKAATDTADTGLLPTIDKRTVDHNRATTRKKKNKLMSSLGTSFTGVGVNEVGDDRFKKLRNVDIIRLPGLNVKDFGRFPGMKSQFDYRDMDQLDHGQMINSHGQLRPIPNSQMSPSTIIEEMAVNPLEAAYIEDTAVELATRQTSGAGGIDPKSDKIRIKQLMRRHNRQAGRHIKGKFRDMGQLKVGLVNSWGIGSNGQLTTKNTDVQDGARDHQPMGIGIAGDTGRTSILGFRPGQKVNKYKAMGLTSQVAQGICMMAVEINKLVEETHGIIGEINETTTSFEKTDGVGDMAKRINEMAAKIGEITNIYSTQTKTSTPQFEDFISISDKTQTLTTPSHLVTPVHLPIKRRLLLEGTPKLSQYQELWSIINRSRRVNPVTRKFDSSLRRFMEGKIDEETLKMRMASLQKIEREHDRNDEWNRYIWCNVHTIIKKVM